MNKHFFSASLLVLFSITTSVQPLNLAQLPYSLNKATTQKPLSHEDFMHKVAGLIQHYAFISHNFVTTTIKNKNSKTSISEEFQAIVDKVNSTYLAMVENMRSKVFASDQVVQKEAFVAFGNYILGLCQEFNIRDSYFMKFPIQLDMHISKEDQLTLIQKSLDALELAFCKIKPLLPLHERIANKLFYNVVSTKIIPKTISFGVGPALTAAWLSYNAFRYNQMIDNHPHSNIFKHYKTVEHDTEITYTKKPNLIERLIGMEAVKEMKITPCHESENICNGDKPKKQKQVAVQSSNQFLQAYQQVMNAQTQYQTVNVHWADGCTNPKANEPCYHYQGYKSLEKIGFNMAWAARPVILIPICYLLGKYLEDIQLSKYEAKVKERIKQNQEKKIQTEMRQLKVNYQQHIGFNQIKGQKNLIEHELRMIVDYLKNPLRYKNSASGTRSILFYGPPGTGKTLMARAIAKESGAPFLEVTADDILHDDAKEKILATMRLAEDIASKRPEKSAIIYIDEIDCVTGNRQDGNLDPQRAKALSNLLTIFDGIEKRNPFVHIMIIITTNHYKNLDPALLRPGRIDRKILIAQPNADGRREFFDSLLPAEHKQLMEWLVQETDGYSGAQIVNIVDTAHMIASYAGRTKPSEEDYKAALQNCKAEYNAILYKANH